MRTQWRKLCKKAGLDFYCLTLQRGLGRCLSSRITWIPGASWTVSSWDLEFQNWCVWENCTGHPTVHRECFVSHPQTVKGTVNHSDLCFKRCHPRPSGWVCSTCQTGRNEGSGTNQPWTSPCVPWSCSGSSPLPHPLPCFHLPFLSEKKRRGIWGLAGPN